MNAIASGQAPSFNLSNKTTLDIHRVLSGQKQRWWSFLVFAGPAVITSVAYIDPGNFATNIQAGAKYGYSLLWVVVFANIIAMLFQALSAKLGIATDCSLPQLCRQHFSRPVSLSMWAVSEVAAIATDLAEFVGGAIGLSLLFHLPLMAGMLGMAIFTFAVLAFGKNGFRPMELIILSLVILIGMSYLAELFLTPVHWPKVFSAAFLPVVPNQHAWILCVGIVGATVMPHAIYLHSGLMHSRAMVHQEHDKKALLRFSNREVILALSLAGLINIAMVIMAAGAFHSGHANVGQIQTAYYTLIPLLGPAAAGIFVLSLIFSGIASSSVGTMAGQMIMQGFSPITIPLWLRRLITIAPAFIIIFLGVNPTQALVLSQVVLSLTLPVPIIALLIFTCRKDIMGTFTNSRLTTVLAVLGASGILILNLILLFNYKLMLGNA